VLAVTLAATGNAPIRVELPRAAAADVAARLIGASDEAMAGLSGSERADLARALGADVLVRVSRDGRSASGLGLSDGRAARAELSSGRDAIGWLVTRVAPAPEVEDGEEEGGSAITSPWLWVGVGLAVAAGAAAAVASSLTSQSTDPLWALESR
jgi:hypothetical protein